MSKGTVKEYDSNRGYGTITDSGTGQLLTVYANSVNLKNGEILVTGQDVQFEIENNRNRNQAINVEIVKKEI